MENNNDTIEVWEDGKDEMIIWFQLPMNSTTGENEHLPQEDCQQDCNKIYTSYILTTLIYNDSETVVIAVNRTSLLVIVVGEIKAGK